MEIIELVTGCRTLRRFLQVSDFVFGRKTALSFISVPASLQDLQPPSFELRWTIFQNNCVSIAWDSGNQTDFQIKQISISDKERQPK